MLIKINFTRTLDFNASSREITFNSVLGSSVNTWLELKIDQLLPNWALINIFD